MSRHSHPEPIREELEHLQPINPISRSWAQGRSVDELWLTRKRPLSNIQRLALLIISILLGVFSCDLLHGAVENMRDGEIVLGSIMAMVGIAGTYLVLRGIWRVWWDVFKRPSAERDEHDRQAEGGMKQSAIRSANDNHDLDRMIDKERSRRIRTAIRDVLMREWDPIGVKDEPMAADEYDMYLGGVYRLLVDGASEKAVAAHLRDIEIRRMGFTDFQTPDRLDVATALKAIPLN